MGYTNAKRIGKSSWAPTVYLGNTKHAVVGRAAEQCDIAAVEEESRSTVVWMDGVVSISKLLSLQPWQRINHFPGMHHICHKDYLARNLGKMRSRFRAEYAFWPRTWCMKTNAGDFMNHAKKFSSSGKSRWFIAKPDSKSRGIGIYVFSKPEQYVEHPEFDMVVQQYIERPLLIDGYKFDMRIYALVTHCDPLRIFVYKEGIARFATEPYGEGPTDSNRKNVCMHLTNYSINKKSAKFVDGGPEGGSKRTLSWALAYLDSLGHDGSGTVWSSIKDIIVKTLITVNPELRRVFRSCFPGTQQSVCFELLGFDILLDSKLRPYVLEINHSPSLACDTSVDRTLKEALLLNTFKLLNLQSLNPGSWTSVNRREAKKRLYTGASTSEVDRASSQSDASDSKNTLKASEVDGKFKHSLPNNLRKIQMDASSGEICDQMKEYEDTHMGQFERIYPSNDCALNAKYSSFLAAAEDLFAVPETTATKARKAFSLAQIDDASVLLNAAPPVRLSPKVQVSSGTPPAPSYSKAELVAHVDVQIQKYLNRKRRLEKNRASLSVSTSTLYAPEFGSTATNAMLITNNAWALGFASSGQLR